MSIGGWFADVTENFDQLVDVHFKGVFSVIQKLLALLADGGSIVNVSTGLTRFTSPQRVVYASVKGAVEVLTRYLAQELGPRGVTVNTIAPGAIATDFSGGLVRDNPLIAEHIASITALSAPPWPTTSAAPSPGYSATATGGSPGSASRSPAACTSDAPDGHRCPARAGGPSEEPIVLVALVTGASSGISKAIARDLADAGPVVYAGTRDLAGRDATCGSRRIARQLAGERCALGAESVDESCGGCRAPSSCDREHCASDGLRLVVATLRTPSRLDDLASRYDADQLVIRALDVTDTAQLRAVVDEAWARLGRIEVVVSNAGSGVIGAAEELTDAHIDAGIATNLVGSMQLARAVIPHLREQGGGRLLQVSSMGGQVTFPGFSLYHVTKWGIEGFFDAIAAEIEPFGIRTTLIEPGVIRTPFYDAVVREPEHPAYAHNPSLSREDIPLDRMPGDQDKVAAAMIDIGDMDDPPHRQVLGSDAYELVTEALTRRLAEIEAGRDKALTTDLDGVAAA